MKIYEPVVYKSLPQISEAIESLTQTANMTVGPDNFAQNPTYAGRAAAKKEAQAEIEGLKTLVPQLAAPQITVVYVEAPTEIQKVIKRFGVSEKCPIIDLEEVVKKFAQVVIKNGPYQGKWTLHTQNVNELILYCRSESIKLQLNNYPNMKSIESDHNCTFKDEADILAWACKVIPEDLLVATIWQFVYAWLGTNLKSLASHDNKVPVLVMDGDLPVSVTRRINWMQSYGFSKLTITEPFGVPELIEALAMRGCPQFKAVKAIKPIDPPLSAQVKPIVATVESTELESPQNRLLPKRGRPTKG